MSVYRPYRLEQLQRSLRRMLPRLSNAHQHFRSQMGEGCGKRSEELCVGVVVAQGRRRICTEICLVITLHWMIAECCRATQACNLLVATIEPHLLKLVVRQPVGRVTQSGMLIREGGWKTQLWFLLMAASLQIYIFIFTAWQSFITKQDYQHKLFKD